MAKNNVQVENTGINIISNGSSITGELTSNGDIRIDGLLNGTIQTKGKIVIGETGIVTGEITCKNADILGKVEGKIMVAELLSLKATASVTGEIYINRLSIEPGCKFNGTCDMTNHSANGNGTDHHVEKNTIE